MPAPDMPPDLPPDPEGTEAAAARAPRSWGEALSMADELPPDAARDLLEQAVPLAKRLRAARLRMIRAELACDAPAAARGWLEEISPKGRKAPDTIRAELMILKAERRDADLCKLGAKAMALGHRLSLQNFLDLARAAVTLGRGKAAVKFAKHALERAPGDSTALHLYYSGILLFLDDRYLLQGMRSALFQPGNGPEHALGLARLWAERPVPLPVMQELVQEALIRWPDTPRLMRTARVLFAPEEPRPRHPADQLARAKARLKQDAEGAFDACLDLDPRLLTRPLADPHDPAEMVLSPRGRSNTVVLHFEGHPGSPVGVDVLDAFHSLRGETTAYLRDDQRLLFLQGIQSLADGFDATVAVLDDWLASVDCRNLICIGRAEGALGALLIGQALGADRIICFSATTTALAVQLQDMPDLRAPVLIRRLNDTLPPARLDVAQALTASEERPRIDLIYGAQNRIDRLHAERLKDLKGVTLYPIAGYSGHPSAQFALRRGFYDAILDDQMETLARKLRD